MRLTASETNAVLTLDKLPAGKEAVILQVGGEGALRLRLLDMGIIPKTKIMVRKVAPMGDPIEIHIRDYELTLRLEDAVKINVRENEVDTK
jgi:ferrous iron transport protein A